MKEVKLDILGRVCIPKQMRESLNLKEDSTVFVGQVNDKIIITGAPIDAKCSICAKVFSSTYMFCPFCGQKLNKEEDNEHK